MRALIRLWASSGQSALENASILIINGTATGASTLKNLVLPGELFLTPNRFKIDRLVGIGKFTIMDNELVQGEDVGNNFFLEKSSLGKFRAEEVVKYLGELNSDVVGLALIKVCCCRFLSSALNAPQERHELTQ